MNMSSLFFCRNAFRVVTAWDIYRRSLLLFVFFSFFSVLWAQKVIGREETAPLRGVYEISFHMTEEPGNPFFDVTFGVEFTRPNRSKVFAEGFYDGERFFKARAYCDQVGVWRFRTKSNVRSLNAKSGSFTVQPSDLPGKLRIHPHDGRQFAYENGDWFLHIGDTGYRYVTDTEPLWQQYIDDGAADFRHIHHFFSETGLTLVGMQPNDAMAGNDGHSVKLIAGERTIIAYLQNPDSRAQETANVAETPAVCRLHLPKGEWRIRWYDPHSGEWHENPERPQITGGYTRDFKSPFAGDGLLLLTLS